MCIIVMLGVLILQNIMVSESRISVTSFVAIYEVQLGDFISVTMTVDPDSYPITGYWTKTDLDGTETVIIVDSVKVLSSDPGQLLLINVEKNDTGFYTCHIRNETDSGHNDPPVLLIISGAPTVSSTMTESTVIPVGQSITIPCTYVSVDPVSDVRWLHTNTTGHSRFVDEKDSSKYCGSTISDPSLTIYDYNEEDLGDYWCQAESSKGTGSSLRISLKVPSDSTTSFAISSMQPMITQGSQNISTDKCLHNYTGHEEYYTKYTSQHVLGEIIVIHGNFRSSIACAFQCMMCNSCTGFNYHTTAKECQLTKSSTNGLYPDSTWDLFA